MSILQAEQDALVPSTLERAILKAATPQTEPILRKKKGPKGPNPLSVKKKAPKHGAQEAKKVTKVVNTSQVGAVDAGSKRKRLDDAAEPARQPRPKRRRRHKCTPSLAESS
jgi:U3 small nucleolar RNA-associated protein 23